MVRAPKDNSMANQNAYYDTFYAAGGWDYDLRTEKVFLRKRIIQLSKWKPGSHVLEVGAGMGHHAELLRLLGFTITAVDASPAAVAYMQCCYPSLQAILADVSEWAPRFSPHHIFARGMSFFHYELDGINIKGVDVIAETRRLFEWLRPGGTFVLQIYTDFSRRKDEIHMNCLQDYVGLFSRFGIVEECTDWLGRPVLKNQLPPNAYGIIIVTRKGM